MTLEIILVLATGATTPLVALQLQSAEAFMDLTLSEVNHQSNCCCIWSNIYVAWWTNNTENNNKEGMFRASNDAGQTFGLVLTLPTNGTIGNTEEGEEEGRTPRNCKSSRDFFFRTIRKDLIMFLYYRNIYPNIGSIDFSPETIRRIV